MKKFFPVIFALFVIGQNCGAQALHSGSALRADRQTHTATIQHAQQRVADSTPNYWVDASSYYDLDGAYIHEGVNYTYMVSITVDGTDVAIEGLVPGSEWNQYETTQAVHGVYDPEAKTVTIETRPFDYTDSDYAKLGTMTYFGSPSTVILLAGNFVDEADDWGQHALAQEKQLVFDVNDDLTVFTSRTGYGAYVYQVSEWGVSGCGFLNFMKRGQISLIGQTPELVASASVIKIEGINVVPGAEQIRTFTVSNKGTDATRIIAECNSNEVSLDYDYSLDGLDTQTFTIYYTPAEAGYFETDIVVRTEDGGSSLTITLQADVNEAPDYSDIVLAGDLTFANDGNTPFVITTDITGFPVAVSTNTTTDGVSILHVYANVPDGETGVLLWKGLCHAAYSMGAIITVDGMQLLNNVYSYMQTWEEERIDNAVVLGSGRHVITFEYDNFASWRAEYAPFDMQMYVYDLDLRTMPTTNDAAVLKADGLDMGPHYVDLLATTDCQYVELINAGLNPLKVTAISQDGAFGGIVDGMVADFGQTLLVPITFTAATAGSYTGQITISTTAGDYVVNCQASAEQIPVDYHPIVKQGKVSFNTSMQYPFSIEGDRAFSSIAYEPTPVGLDSWIELCFEVPAGKEVDLEWEAKNSSQDFMYFMDDKVFTDGTIVEVDGQEVDRYAGEYVDLSSYNFHTKYTHFGEGRHTIRFTYHKVDSMPAGEDRFTIWNVRLIGGEETGLDLIGEQDLQRITYNLQGQRLDAPQHGISIVEQHNADGSSYRQKVLRK